MGEIEWAVWANEQAIPSSLLIILGGIVGTTSNVFKTWMFNWIYALVFGLLVFLLEYPRSKRKKGNTKLRKYQYYIGILHSRCGVFSKNYFIRFILYMILPIPCCFLLPTLIGGLCLFISSIIYLIAALKGEFWENPDPKEENSTVLTQPPTTPPPRLMSATGDS